MPQSSGRARSALLTLALALIPAAAAADNKEGSIELGLAATFIRFDSQAEMDHRFGPTFHLGYNFTKRHGAELSFTSVTATPNSGPSFPIDVDVARLGYVFNAYPRERMVSFFRFGVGAWKIDPEPHPRAPERISDPDNNLLLYSGGGVRFFLHDRLAVRFAATVDAVDFGDGILNPDIHASGDFGLVFLLGGRDAAEPSGETEAPTEPPSETPDGR
ncbi:MAG TPA: outer membrane beta-barrel protein [Candidatus Polarisedimenticolia bacterium]|nr:outer membrane beta-barrel protein [Candidatus Polarisedimenticolia bacterium]